EGTEGAARRVGPPVPGDSNLPPTAGAPDGREAGLLGVVDLLLDLRLLAAQVTQVVQLRPAHVAASDDLDPVDHRSVHGEGALHTDAEADLAHGEGLTDSVALAADHDALEHLDPGAVALDDPDVHVERVTGPEVGYV